MKKQTDENYSPSCCFCAHASQLADTEVFLCTKHGAVNGSFRCRSYKFDPLKPSPRKSPVLPDFDVSDFNLDSQDDNSGTAEER